MSNTPQIKLGQPEDIAKLADIELAAGSLFPPGRIPDPDATTPIAKLHTAIDKDSLWVAEQGESPVGFAVCEVIDEHLFLAEVSVHPDHGRRGIGRALVANAIRASAHRGLAGVTLTTFADLDWNAPFYASMGFETTDEESALPHIRAHLQAERQAGMTHRVGMLRHNFKRDQKP